ncbi:hypothetical protein MTO96_020605 [Rhipicephalus appendiculatus]
MFPGLSENGPKPGRPSVPDSAPVDKSAIKSGRSARLRLISGAGKLTAGSRARAETMEARSLIGARSGLASPRRRGPPQSPGATPSRPARTRPHQ